MLALAINRGRGRGESPVSSAEMMPSWVGQRPRLPTAVDLQAKLALVAAIQNATAAVRRAAADGAPGGGCVLVPG